MDRIAIFPGSFDPFTRGHASIVEQALLLFDKVVIAIGVNNSKPGLLSPRARITLIEDLYANNPAVSVEMYEGLTYEFARSKGAVAMVRGVRNGVDFEYERNLEATNRALAPEIATVVLFTLPHLAHISSSVVRELMHFDHSVEKFMPEGVDIKKYLQ